MTQELEQRFLTARKTYIEKCFSRMNPMQLEAVLTTQGPLLLLAGAGSGKTTVLINRIANLIRFGCAADSDELPPEVSLEDVLFLEQEVSAPREENRARADALCAMHPAAPWSIIAITFTNKAANELKERLTTMLGPEANDVWAMTFHSACCRRLRRRTSCFWSRRFPPRGRKTGRARMRCARCTPRRHGPLSPSPLQTRRPMN